MAKSSNALLAQPNNSFALALKLGAIHALIDGASSFLVFSEIARHELPYEQLSTFIFLYNSLAFGSQWFIGIIADRQKAHSLIVGMGPCFIACAALFKTVCPFAAFALCGLGNALFHVGAGGVVLRTSRFKAMEAGIFVAPGAIGLASGIGLASSIPFNLVPYVVVLLLSSIVLAHTTSDTVSVPPPEKQRPNIRLIFAVVAALLFSIIIRSTVGGLLNNAWQHSTDALLLLALAATLGKCLGGALADRYGWQRVGTLSLLIAVPLVIVGLTEFDVAALGMLLVQLTMPITLSAIYFVLPKHPGLAFGLSSLALYAGTLAPSLASSLTGTLVAAALLLSALFFFCGIGFIGQKDASMVNVK